MRPLFALCTIVAFLMPTVEAGEAPLANGAGTIDNRIVTPGVSGIVPSIRQDAQAAVQVHYTLRDDGRYVFSLSTSAGTWYYYFDEDISFGGSFERTSGSCGYRQVFTVDPFRDQVSHVELSIMTDACSSPPATQNATLVIGRN